MKIQIQEYTAIQYHSLNTRTSPNLFIQTIQQLNDQQRQSVVEMGFGDISDLRATSLGDPPCKLAYWLVDNFDLRGCTLKLPNGMEIEITRRDVHVTLEFPMGDRGTDLEERESC